MHIQEGVTVNDDDEETAKDPTYAPPEPAPRRPLYEDSWELAHMQRRLEEVDRRQKQLTLLLIVALYAFFFGIAVGKGPNK